MKNFLVKAAIFSAIILACMFIFDKVASKKMRQSEYRINAVWKEIFEGKLENDVVILGSSRAFRMYNPLIMDSILHCNCYNLGLDGRGFDSYLLRYKTYVRYNSKPEITIINLDYNIFRNAIGVEREQFFPYFFDKQFRDYVVEMEHLGFVDKYLPALRYAGYFNQLKYLLGLKKSNEPALVKGYLAAGNAHWNGTEIAQITEIECSRDTAIMNLFDKFLNDETQNGVKIIFVYAPLHITAIEKIKDIEGMFEMYDKMAKKYDIPVLNYTYNTLSYDTAYFYNASHLNNKGAELFSGKLAHDINALGIVSHNQ